MKLVAQVKLLPTEEQRRALVETLHQTNAACNRLSAHAWEAKCFPQFDLHAALYQSIREKTGLNFQVVVRAIAKVADAYKLDKARPRTFQPEGSIAYDSRILRFFTDAQEVSIWTVAGRTKIAFAAGEKQKAMLLTQKGESDLVYIGAEFYLMAVCEVPEAPRMPVTDVLGVDLGIVQLASDSEGNQYTGEPIRSLRRRMRTLKAGLQHTAKTRQSTSARRHLQRLRRRQSRFTRWVNHNISRRLVEAAAASGKAIALEDPSGLRLCPGRCTSSLEVGPSISLGSSCATRRGVRECRWCLWTPGTLPEPVGLAATAISIIESLSRDSNAKSAAWR